MTCSTNDNNLSPPISPGPEIPGFGSVSSPIQIPLDLANLPTELVESLTDLSNAISAQFPSGIYKANPDHNAKTVLDFIANVMTQLSPALSTYNFFIALLKLPVCIIEVLCKIPDPFQMADKLKKLFATCLPPYLNLFPAAALAIMIISLLLLIIALIEYIITLLIQMIEDIVKNLQVLSNGAALNDANATLAAASKIAAVLCDIENVMAIFIALAAILEIIKSLAQVGGFLICAADDEDETCPPWIKNTPDGIIVPIGILKYTSQIGADLSGSLPPELAAALNIPPLREERWQLYDTAASPLYPLNVIITDVDDHIFWPDPLEFESDLSLKKAPFLVDVTVTVNPAQFAQLGLPREFIVKDCIVVRKPYLGVYQFDNEILDTPITGTINIEGGLVYEADGTTPYLIAGVQAALNQLIHLPDSSATSLPGSDDSIIFGVSFTWKPNVPGLAGYQLTTIGCIPAVSVEANIQNAIILEQGLDPIIDKLDPVPPGTKVPSSGNFLPNISGGQACVASALSDFRAEVSIAKAAEFQASITTCLNDLKGQALFTLCATLIAAVNRFKSLVELNPNLQFVTRPIQVIVTLKDAGGINLAIGIPEDCGQQMADLLSATATFGSISKFTYDSNLSAFTALLTGLTAGSGILSVTFKDQPLASIVIGTAETNSSIVDQEINYQFVDATTEPIARRDATDVGNV